MSLEKKILSSLEKISNSLEFLANKKKQKEFSLKTGFLDWDCKKKKLSSLNVTHNIQLKMLLNIEEQKKIVLKNTIQFAKGYPANNILLWGGRGTGKSSLISLVFHKVYKKYKLSMIEIRNSRLENLGFLIEKLSVSKEKYIIFCDDFSFNYKEKNLSIFKNILDGSLRKFSNIIFYATSNYRHMVKDHKEEQTNKILEKEKFEDISALSDRFGIWLSFPSFDKKTYIKVINNYCKLYALDYEKDLLEKKALEWRLNRGSSSGREAFNFIKYVISHDTKEL